MKKYLKKTWEILKDTRENFEKGEPIVYSAAIAFFTIFSLPALLIVFSLIGSMVFDDEEVRAEITEKAGNLIGDEASEQVGIVLENVADLPVSFWGILLGIVVVAKSATIVFIIMQKAMNSVWQVKVKSNAKYWKILAHRLITLAIVAGLGVLLLLSILLDTIIYMYSERLFEVFDNFFTPAVRAINTVFYFFVVLVFFTSIHKILPDARVAWKDALTGGIITSILFIIGKEVINLVLESIKVVGIYAAAGSLVVVLLWVFYSSIILMLGAQVTKAYANNHDRDVEPNSIAEKYEKVSAQAA